MTNIPAEFLDSSQLWRAFQRQNSFQSDCDSYFTFETHCARILKPIFKTAERHTNSAEYKVASVLCIDGKEVGVIQTKIYSIVWICLPEAVFCFGLQIIGSSGEKLVSK